MCYFACLSKMPIKYVEVCEGCMTKCQKSSKLCNNFSMNRTRNDQKCSSWSDFSLYLLIWWENQVVFKRNCTKSQKNSFLSFILFAPPNVKYMLNMRYYYFTKWFQSNLIFSLRFGWVEYEFLSNYNWCPETPSEMFSDGVFHARITKAPIWKESFTQNRKKCHLTIE